MLVSASSNKCLLSCIISGRTSANLIAKAFVIIFTPTFNNELAYNFSFPLDLLSCISFLLHLPSVFHSFVLFARILLKTSMKKSFMSFQKKSINLLVIPFKPGLPFGRVVFAVTRSFPDNGASSLFFCSLLSLMLIILRSLSWGQEMDNMFQ